MALVIDLMLRENATQVGHPGLSLAVRPFAFPALQFLWAHGYTRGVAAEIHDGCRVGARQRYQCLARLPDLGVGTHRLYQPFELPGRHLTTAGLLQMAH